MYKRLLCYLSVYQTRTCAIHATGACVLSTKCDIVTLPICRAVNRGGLRALGTTSTTYCENKERPGGEEEDIKNEAKNDGELQKAANAKPQKSGKESLLDMLTTMKVKVTSKKVQQPSDADGEPEQQRAANGRRLRTVNTISLSQLYRGKEELLVPGLEDLKNDGEFQEAVNAKPQGSGMKSRLDTKLELTNKKRANLKQSGNLSPELVAAASAAASTLPNQDKAVCELLRQLRQHEELADVQKKGEVNNIRDIIADMKVGKTSTKPQTNERPIRGGYEREDTDQLGDRLPRKRVLGKNKRLNIFACSTEQDVAATNITPPTLWDIELANQIALSTTQIPRNGFEEMIQWTKEGRLWQYPINNEAGMEEEASIPFHEHVFLEKHLEVGFPRQGPVRHFMELVVAGLAKNPYLTVLQKKEHIAWFREYFQQKEDVLKEAKVFLN